MGLTSLDGETVLDLTVNPVPVAILFVLDVVFFLVTPWGWNLWIAFWMHFLTLFPLVALLVLTYVGGRVIERDEERLEGDQQLERRPDAGSGASAGSSQSD